MSFPQALRGSASYGHLTVSEAASPQPSLSSSTTSHNSSPNSDTCLPSEPSSFCPCRCRRLQNRCHCHHFIYLGHRRKGYLRRRTFIGHCSGKGSLGCLASYLLAAVLIGAVMLPSGHVLKSCRTPPHFNFFLLCAAVWQQYRSSILSHYSPQNTTVVMLPSQVRQCSKKKCRNRCEIAGSHS